MNLIPGVKIGYADTLEKALEIINNANLLQDHGEYKTGDIIESTPCGVWPTLIPIDISQPFVAHSIKEFENLCTKGFKKSTVGKVVIMELEDKAFALKVEAACKRMELEDEAFKLRIEAALKSVESKGE